MTARVKHVPSALDCTPDCTIDDHEFGGRHEGKCDRCLGHNPVWTAPNELWNACIRQPDGSDRWGFLCPSCFAEVYDREVRRDRGLTWWMELR